MKKVLVVEDNVALAFGLKINFEHDGYETTVAETGQDALHALQSEVDCVILDLMLPDMSGFEVLRRVRSEYHYIPVLIVSALAEEHVRVSAFRQGADDFIPKPFSLLELLERVKARMRITQLPNCSTGIFVSIERHEVRCNGVPVHLAPLEFEVLCALINADGAVLSYDDLLAKVWSLPIGWNTRTAITHVGNLRRKLQRAGVSGAIRTVPKRGVAWTLGRCLE